MNKYSIVIAALLVLQAAGRATEPPAPTDVPQSLEPAADETIAMVVPRRRGADLRVPRSPEPTGNLRVDVIAPQADLFDVAGNRIGRHFFSANERPHHPGAARHPSS